MSTRSSNDHEDLVFSGAPELPDEHRYRVITREETNWLGLICLRAEVHVQIVRSSPGRRRPARKAPVVAEVVAFPVDQFTRRPTAVLPRSALAELARKAAEQMSGDGDTRATVHHLMTV